MEITAQTYYSRQLGDWNQASTWSLDPSGEPPASNPPGSTNDVEIRHEVSITSEVTINDISIKPWPGLLFLKGDKDISAGTISIDAGGELTTHWGPAWTGIMSTSGNMTVKGTFNFSSNGIFNIGNGVENGFIIQGGSFAWSGGIINISGYYALNSGIVTLSSNLEMNVSTAGVRGEDNYNYYVDESANITFNAVSLTVNIQNGNNNAGNIAEVYQENATLGGISGSNLNLNMLNNDADVGPFYYVSDIAINNFASDIGTGNTLYFNSVTLYDSVFFDEVILTSGSCNVGIDETIYNYFNFYNNQSEDITIDGELIIPGTLTLASSIIGDGIVQAGTYDYGPDPGFQVYGIQPDDGGKSAGGTWRGGSDNNWFDAGNWSQKIPGTNTAVIIHSDYNLGNWPILTSGDAADARSVELDGNGANLSINTNGELTISEQGSSGRGGDLIVGQQSDCFVTNGTLIVETNLSIDDNASFNVSNGGTVSVKKDVNVNAGGALNINSGSVNIGPLSNKK